MHIIGSTWILRRSVVKKLSAKALKEAWFPPRLRILSTSFHRGRYDAQDWDGKKWCMGTLVSRYTLKKYYRPA